MAALTRRAFLAGGVAAGVGLAVGIPFGTGVAGTDSTGFRLVSQAPRPSPFTTALPRLPVLAPTTADDGTDHYEIVSSVAAATILPGLTTPIFGYAGRFPGPTIESRRGRPVVVRHRNRLPVPMVVHLHGGHTAHDSDGYPTDLIYPVGWRSPGPHGSMEHGAESMPVGDTTIGVRNYRYPMQQRAAMLWYHDHRMDFTGPDVWHGLAGLHIVRDDEEDALGLPRDRQELALVLTDRSFAADGSFSYPSVDPSLTMTPGVTGDFVAGVLGDVMLVNGVPWPVADVDRATYRLRVVNAGNARRLRLRLAPAPMAGLIQIGSDGGLLAAPQAHEAFDLAPAERLDALVDFNDFPPGAQDTLLDEFGEGAMHQVMQFRVGSTVGPRYSPPQTLSTVERLDPARATVTRSFRFSRGSVGHRDGWIVNGEPFSPTAVAAIPRLGEVEIWELFADFHHPVHVHLDPFQVVGRGIGGPGPCDAGWKDTLDLHPGEQARIAVRFTDYRGRFVFHCHNLEHEDMAMMANFVTAP